MESIHKKYHKMIEEHGAEIKKIIYITTEEYFSFLYGNTDFTPAGIRNLRNEGESKRKEALCKMGL